MRSYKPGSASDQSFARSGASSPAAKSRAALDAASEAYSRPDDVKGALDLTAVGHDVLVKYRNFGVINLRRWRAVLSMHRQLGRQHLAALSWEILLKTMYLGRCSRFSVSKNAGASVP